MDDMYSRAKTNMLAYGAMGAALAGKYRRYQRKNFNGSPASMVYARQGMVRQAGFYGRYNKRPRYSSGARVNAGQELKFKDTALTFSIDATSEFATNLALIAQGATESQRIGRKAIIKSIYLKGVVEVPDSATDLKATTVVLYIVWDKQCNGASPTFTDVFTGAQWASAFINLENSARFKVLGKIVVNLDKYTAFQTAGTAAGRSVYVEKYIKCNIPMSFSGATGVVTEIADNNICLLSGSTNTDDQATFFGACRVRFEG